MQSIKNRADLLSVGDQESRRIALDILDETLRGLDSYYTLKEMARVDSDGILTIGEKSWDLKKKRNVYVIGAGKAANAMARAFDEILGDWLTDGVAIVKIPEERDNFKHIRLRVGGHPLPIQSGYDASMEILEMVDQAQPDDLFIGLMSGGCSSLMSCPMEGMTLEEEIRTRDVMLKSGANVVEVNSVCRHVSRVNGGKLAKRIEQRGAEMICLLIQDAIGFPKTVNPGKPVWFGFTPMAPDATTLEMAKEAIDHFHVADKLPKKVIDFYESCTEADETPKSLKRWTGYLVNTLPDSTALAMEAARKRGLNAMLLSNYLEGEAREVGTVFASIAKEIQESGHPIAAPCVIVATGEMSVRIPDEPAGIGGPGQEMAASFAIAARNTNGACVISVDSEGTDGPTDSAGGIADSKTYAASQEQGIDLYKALREHAVYDALSALNCEVITGNTGTNLCDLHIMYVPAKEESSL